MGHTKMMIGVDTAKRVFQLHWVDKETGEIVSLQLKRDRFLGHFAKQEPCLIGMEACGGPRHWARQLLMMGHEAKPLPGKQVKPFVGGNKSDVHDARALGGSAATRDQVGGRQERGATSRVGIAPEARPVG
jgi:transposase